MHAYVYIYIYMHAYVYIYIYACVLAYDTIMMILDGIKLV